MSLFTLLCLTWIGYRVLVKKEFLVWEYKGKWQMQPFWEDRLHPGRTKN